MHEKTSVHLEMCIFDHIQLNSPPKREVILKGIGVRYFAGIHMNSFMYFNHTADFNSTSQMNAERLRFRKTFSSSLSCSFFCIARVSLYT